ncbi:MAG TPA: FG-GAP-like repeat-containing protein, partial [Pyrinomonadaceae bacterium]|nr:FG-GAP-like repeat-containing protein [Pyrinomonadaceae bacterium]
GSSTIDCVALQSDGKILIGGSFSGVNGSGRSGIARLESNGALDATFIPALGGTAAVKAIVVEANGKIVIGGTFTGVNGDPRNNLARVQSNGATDLAFNSAASPISSIVRQTDAKYLVTENNFGKLSRQNADGSLDASFTPPTFGYSSTPLVFSILQLADGSILVGGRFDTVNGLSRRNLTRLRSNGSHVTTFMPNGANADVGAMQLYASDKVMIGGTFISVDNVGRVGVARLTVPALQFRTRFDFDGDGKAEIAVYRASSGVWYQLFSGGGPYGRPVFGLAGDIPTPADFDGDGKTDVAIWRPSNGQWWWSSSLNGQLCAATLGQAGDIPMPSDVNGDGTDEPVVYRPSNGTWYWATTTGFFNLQFGIPGDVPVIGDFDGDGKSDRAIFRPSNGDWWYSASGSGGAHRTAHWGATGDIPTPADFDGDGKTDFAVFRPSNGGWYVRRSSNGSWFAQGFGLAGDRPVAADFDGDGRADIAVFRPSTGVWYLLQSTAGSGGVNWGLATDVAVPNAFTQQ